LGDTEEIAGSVLCLPMFNELEEADVERESESVLSFHGTTG
jgi:dTDP-4-amino-4,6-dideoxygalactose transaminase